MKCNKQPLFIELLDTNSEWGLKLWHQETEQTQNLLSCCFSLQRTISTNYSVSVECTNIAYSSELY